MADVVIAATRFCAESREDKVKLVLSGLGLPQFLERQLTAEGLRCTPEQGLVVEVETPREKKV